MLIAEYFPGLEVRRGRSFSAGFPFVMLCITIIFLAGAFVLALADYRRSEALMQQQLRHFAELLSQSLESSLSVASVKMGGLLDDFSYMPFEFRGNIDGIYGKQLRDTVINIEQIDSLLFIDDEGTVIWATTEPLVGINLSDRSYFQDAIGLPRGAFTVGKPIVSRGTGRRLTPIAWPITGWSGDVRGVIASSLGENYFQELLSLQDFDGDMSVRILAADGSTAFSAGPEAPNSPSSSITARRSLDNLGLDVQISLSRSSALQSYWQRTIAFAIVAAVLFLTVLISAVWSRMQSVRLAASLDRSEIDRIKIETAKREFDAIFENVGDGLVVFDDAGALRRSNRAARRYLGAEDDEIAVTRIRDLLPPLNDMPPGNELYKVKLPVRSLEDAHKTIQCRVMKLTIYETAIAYCVLEDMSAEERLAETRMSFITSVNHELRTPLTSLSGALDLLRDRFDYEIPPGAKKLVNMASRNADRLLVLVNDILTLQAIDHQQLSIHREPIRVSDALSEALTTNAGYGLAHDVHLVATSLPESDDPFLFLDRVRLQQILANLISNAIKYSPSGSEVLIGAHVRADDVRFFVSDKGPGVPAKAIHRIFERFGEPIHSRDVQAGGTGLGLAITRELVSRQGGKICFDSFAKADGVQDSGTTFFVTFQRHDKMELKTA
ncbi:ATP-binding protein [Palleronia pelagia]|uniref:histidine kinase n=1 Tax=Palleronia pelagia TaxID=387096 RepID=A0A1H8HD00_9RHOB|nr:ATP-binding protein [Palleronia pelagia]SEN53864.1 Signal transduction histidine kinase [Palleronia pelagia]